MDHVPMGELDHKEDWVLKNWCFWIVVSEKTLESPLDSKEIKPINPKGNQSWIFIGRTDGEAEAPILWSPDVKSQLLGKDPDAEKRLMQLSNWTRMKVKVTQSCSTLCDPVDYTVHGILQARILGWVAFPCSRGSSQPRSEEHTSELQSP